MSELGRTTHKVEHFSHRPIPYLSLKPSIYSTNSYEDYVVDYLKIEMLKYKKEVKKKKKTNNSQLVVIVPA